MASYRIVLLGAPNAGKTTLFFQFARGEEVFKDSTHYDHAYADVAYEGTYLEYNDVSEKTNPQNLKNFLEYTDVVLICCDATNKESLNTIEPYIKTATDSGIDKKNIILVGTKYDDDNESSFQVSKEKAETYAKQHNISFFATSVKNGTGLAKLAQHISKLLLNVTPSPPRSSLRILETCDAITKKLTAYKNSGPKFLGFFQQDPQRATQIEEIKKILNTAKNHKEMAEKLYRAKLEIIASHRNQSLMANLGFTTSRLAETLEDCLQELDRNDLLGKDTLKKIKDDVTKDRDPKKKITPKNK